MARWTEEPYEWKVVEGTLEELRKKFRCIEGNVRDCGPDVWLGETGLTGN